MFDVGKRLKEIRENKGISQDKLAKLLGISKVAVSNYEAGRRNLSIEKLEEILKHLDCSLKDFFETTHSNDINNNNTEEKTVLKKYNKIPIVPLRLEIEPNPKNCTDFFDGAEIEDFVMLPKDLIKDCDFSIFMSGDSMLPTLKSDELALGKKSNFLSNGMLGLFELNGVYLIRKYMNNPILNKCQLIPLNSNYPTITVKKEDSFKILGEIVGLLDWNI